VTWKETRDDNTKSRIQPTLIKILPMSPMNRKSVAHGYFNWSSTKLTVAQVVVICSQEKCPFEKEIISKKRKHSNVLNKSCSIGLHAL